MNNFSFDDIQRRDLLSALGLWLVVELVSFVLFPALGLINPGARLRSWFLLSVPLGIGGAILIGFSSRFVAVVNDAMRKDYRLIYTYLGQFGGWLGLLGILFPFCTVCVEFFSAVKL